MMALRRQEALKLAVTLKHEFAQFAHAEILLVPGDSRRVRGAAPSEARSVSARECETSPTAEESMD